MPKIIRDDDPDGSGSRRELERFMLQDAALTARKVGLQSLQSTIVDAYATMLQDRRVAERVARQTARRFGSRT
jgi:hypothetical protein